MATAKKYFHRFKVRGTGEFPIDMMRYDRCYPRTETDAITAQTRASHSREVEMIAPVRERYWTPTKGRWESFGWAVINSECHEYVNGI